MTEEWSCELVKGQKAEAEPRSARARMSFMFSVVCEWRVVRGVVGCLAAKKISNELAAEPSREI